MSKAKPEFLRILVIPDTQCKPGVPLDHLTWAGRYIADHRPDIIVHLGDHWDFPSLSSYDVGKHCFEGRRVIKDIKAGNKGMKMLEAPFTKIRGYSPEMYFLFGNHEDRLTRLLESEPRLRGLVGFDKLHLDKWSKHDFLKPLELEGIAWCLAPHHRILTADLRWKELGSVRVGEKILAFGENANTNGAHGRRYREAEVLAADPGRAPLYRVTLRNGDQFEATSDHLWLTRTPLRTSWEWVRTSDLVAKRHETCKLFSPWEEDRSWEAGWLSGFFDGEGCLSKPNEKQGGYHISVAQNPGAALDRAKNLLDHLGIKYIERAYKKCHSLYLTGTLADKIAFLGRTRPVRLLRNLQPGKMGRAQHTEERRSTVVESVEPIGQGDIIYLKTSTGTMIADGYAHHNCHYLYNPKNGRPYTGTALSILKNVGTSFVMGHRQGLETCIQQLPMGGRRRGVVVGSFYEHDENYLGPQGEHWRGLLMLNEVHEGDFDLCEVSLSYLRRKYGRSRAS